MKNKIFDFMICALFSGIIALFFLCCLLPDKDKNGNYTQFRYYYDNQYYEQNF